MRFKVEPTRRALDDADQGFMWIFGEAPEAAIRWYDGLVAAFKSLYANPKRCPLAPENEFFEAEIRQLLYGNYRIIFTIKDRTVYILRVRHGARKHLTSEDGE